MPHVNIKGQYVPFSYGSWTPQPVNMPVIPGITITMERPETAPSRGIVSPPKQASAVEMRIAAIREVYEEWRAEA